MAEDQLQLRIGELSRRVDVDPALLRAWERRYGLLEPSRSEGNFRLYSSADLARVRAMKKHLARGLAAAEAARLAVAEPAAEDGDVAIPPPGEPVETLHDALINMREEEAHDQLDQIFALHSLDDAIVDVILPSLREIGEGWATGEVSVAQEHFASGLIRARLLALGRGWSLGSGPTAMLACPSGEQHDIGLICFGLLLWRHGWRINYIGQNAPAPELLRAVPTVRPDLLVMSSFTRSTFEKNAEELRNLAEHIPLAIAGAGADPDMSAAIGALLLDGDPSDAAQKVSVGLIA